MFLVVHNGKGMTPACLKIDSRPLTGRLLLIQGGGGGKIENELIFSAGMPFANFKRPYQPLYFLLFPPAPSQINKNVLQV